MRQQLWATLGRMYLVECGVPCVKGIAQLAASVGVEKAGMGESPWLDTCGSLYCNQCKRAEAECLERCICLSHCMFCQDVLRLRP